jgi:hypothetical protein
MSRYFLISHLGGNYGRTGPARSDGDSGVAVIRWTTLAKSPHFISISTSSITAPLAAVPVSLVEEKPSAVWIRTDFESLTLPFGEHQRQRSEYFSPHVTPTLMQGNQIQLVRSTPSLC